MFIEREEFFWSLIDEFLKKVKETISCKKDFLKRKLNLSLSGFYSYWIVSPSLIGMG
jgi:hypothetical protein